MLQNLSPCPAATECGSTQRPSATELDIWWRWTSVVGVVQRLDCGVVELRILGTCSEASGND